MGLVLGEQTCKSKVNTETLMWQLNTVRIESILDRRHFLEFFLDTRSALIKSGAWGIFFEFWNPMTVFVELGSDQW